MKMIQTIEHTIYGYQPDEFMPIYENGELVNRDRFISYKVSKLAGALGGCAYAGFERVVTLADTLMTHMEAK